MTTIIQTEPRKRSTHLHGRDMTGPDSSSDSHLCFAWMGSPMGEGDAPGHAVPKEASVTPLRGGH